MTDLKNIWVFDDSEDDSDFIKHEFADCNVSSIDVFKEVLELPSSMPDLILLDMFMTTRTAFDVLKNLKEHIELKDVLTVLVSGASPYKGWDEYDGNLLFCEKPVTKEKIQRIIESCEDGK